MDPAMRVWLMMVVVCDCVCRLTGPPGVCMWMSGGGGQKEFVSCCDNFYYGLFYIYSVCLFIIINLNAFRVSRTFFLHVAFKLMSL